ncbi:MAG: YraN family protein [Candidatus Korobacteraceae bacterium]
MVWLTRIVARSLGKASRYLGTSTPEHLKTARWGEMEAYFYLRSLGYRIVARNFRTPQSHGEIDIIGWDDSVLCFIEVKTHSQTGLVPPEMAVDAAKKAHIRSVARRYVRHLRCDGPPACRFDIVSVILGDERRGPIIKLYKGAFSWRTVRPADREAPVPDYRRHWWRR